MEATDSQILSKWAEVTPRPAEVKAVLSADEEGHHLLRFCENLQSLAPQIKIDYHHLADDAESFLRVTPNIVYQAVPSGKELELFLAVLSGALFSEETGTKVPVTIDLSRLPVAPLLEVYISSHCPFCPRVVEPLLLLAGQCRDIQLHVIDGTLFAAKSQLNNISAAPTVILNQQFRWTGQVAPEEILEVAVNSEEADFGVDTLRTIVENGNAAMVAEMIIDRGTVYPALFKLLCHEKWSVRLGAMVVFEYLNENSGDLTRQVVETLWNDFDKQEDPVKGDILYMFGESGRPEAVEKIRTVIETGGYAPEVMTAAREALEDSPDGQ